MAGFEIAQLQVVEGDAHQRDDIEADERAHLADLAVAALVQDEAENGVAPLTAEEAHACGQHGPMTDFEIEIRDGAYDEETLAKLRTGEMHLEYDDYGIKWRAWHGHPYHIQMEREPWPDA